MEDPAWLAIWLLGLFALIGFVMAAVAKIVLGDTMEHDKRFVWRTTGDAKRGKKSERDEAH